MQFSGILIDKNPKTRKVFEKLVRKTSPLRLLKSCSTANDAVDTLLNNHVDIVFLDVEMLSTNEIDFIKSVDYNHSQLIIVSGTRKFAKEAFDLNVTDYLLQPLTRERLLAAVAKARHMNHATTTNLEAENIMFIKQDGNYLKVNLDDILYVKAMGDYISVQCPGLKYVVKHTMKHALGRLPANKFMRTHQSYIVNVDKIAVLNDKLILDNKVTIPYSRAYKKALIKKLNVL